MHASPAHDKLLTLMIMCAFVQVHIPSTHMVQAVGAATTHTRYAVHVTLDDGRCYQVAHRFRDFVQLLKTLKAAGVVPAPAWADVTKARAVTGSSRCI